MKKKLKVFCGAFLILFVFSGIAFADDKYDVIDIHTFDPFDVSRDFSHEYINEDEGKAELYLHHIYANAPGGESRVFNELSLVPGGDLGNNSFSSRTHINYDSLDTGSQLNAGESSSIAVYEGSEGSVSDMDMYWNAAGISQGVIDSDMQTDADLSGRSNFYDFSAGGVHGGEISAGIDVMSASGDAEGMHSEVNYSHKVTASGDVRKFHYKAYYSSGKPSSCPW